MNACCEQTARNFDAVIAKVKTLPIDKRPTGTLDVTQNGTYNAPSDIKGYSTVNVDVQGATPPVLGTLDVTANGTYTPPTGTDGYNEVNVNVQTPLPVLDTIDVTANGTYTPPEGTDGYNKVNVNVQTSPPVLDTLDVTSNGTYTPPAGTDGYNEVNVKVPSIKEVRRGNTGYIGKNAVSNVVDGYNYDPETANGISNSLSYLYPYNEGDIAIYTPSSRGLKIQVDDNLNVTANGVYTPLGNALGFKQVTVNVPASVIYNTSFTSLSPTAENSLTTTKANPVTDERVLEVTSSARNTSVFNGKVPKSFTGCSIVVCSLSIVGTSAENGVCNFQCHARPIIEFYKNNVLDVTLYGFSEFVLYCSDTVNQNSAKNQTFVASAPTTTGRIVITEEERTKIAECNSFKVKLGVSPSFVKAEPYSCDAVLTGGYTVTFLE